MTWRRPAGALLLGVAAACTIDTSFSPFAAQAPGTAPAVTAHLLGAVLVVLAGLVTVATLISLAVAFRVTDAAARSLAELAVPAPPVLLRVTAPMSLPPVLCLESDLTTALCAGGLHPRIYLSSGLVDRLSAEELRAVLLHEASHARRRDPLRRQLRRAVATALFFLPVMGSWVRRGAIVDELRADRAVISVCGPEPLARALLLTAPGPAQAAAGMDGAASLRVAHLIGTPVRLPMPRLGEWAVSLVGAVAALLALLCASTALS